MRYLIGLDIGTSSVKGVLMSVDGKIEKEAHSAFAYRISDKITEITPENFLSSCFSAIETLVRAAGDSEILGICAASASGNLLLVDKEGNPTTPVINWQDRRVSDEAREILGDIDADTLYSRIGWPFDFKTFPLAQACYIKKHNPELLRDCGKVCMSTEYLYYVMTGKWGISGSAGTPFYFIDQVSGKYIPELLGILEIPEEKLPPIMPCGKILGKTTDELEEKTGIPSGIPVVLGTFDHPSAARGAGVLDEGELLLSCGTSWVGFFPIRDREKIANANMLIDPFLAPCGCWGAMTSVPSVSARIKLYVERYIDNSDKAFDILSDLSKKSVPGAEGLAINLFDEPSDEKILAYPKEHIARAISEGAVNLLKSKLEDLKKFGISANSATMVGGPSENPVLVELISQMCGFPVKVTHGASAGAVGAAIMAGIGVGEYDDEVHAQKIMRGEK